MNTTTLSEEITGTIISHIDSVEDGNADALQLFIELKRIEKTLAAAMKQIKDEAMTDAATYGEKTFEAFGAKVEMKSGGGRWNYKKIDSWTRLKDELEQIELVAKQASKMRDQGKAMIDGDGVIVEPAEFMPNAETIAISIIKKS